MLDPNPVVGIIANPVSARDIRRVIANATNLQIVERANIVMRVLACLAACDVKRVLMMPENGGIRAHISRWLKRAANVGEVRFPSVGFVDMPVTGTVDDTLAAVRAMRECGVAALVVLGGDGTHRAAASECGSIPIAGISTGTNNAFPEHREATITGLAVGLAVTGLVPDSVAYAPNKRLKVSVNGSEKSETAIVDVAVVSDRYVGARALWRVESFEELYVTFADPEVIGMSAIAGLLEPVTRTEATGLMIRFAPPETAEFVLHAPIAPGMIRPIGIHSWRRIDPGETLSPAVRGGSLALDGEREFSFNDRDRIALTLERDAFRTVDVAKSMQYAARHALMRALSPHVAVKEAI
jgi:predicted polyphosphate/ATP-dependent NAD kinase